MLRKGIAAVNHFEMIKIDSHQHFWHYAAADFGWIDEPMSALKRDFLPDDLQPLLDASGFNGSVAVQARQTLEETRWLLELAAEHNFVRGVVGWVDLCSTRLRDQLKGLTGSGKLVGVRHVVQDEADDRFMLRPEFRRGIGQLSEFGLVYDLLLHPRHLAVAAKLVSEFPAQGFVLDHIAKPPIADGLIEPWRSEIRELAQLPNVACKISGMVTEALWSRWALDDFRPYLDVVFEAFGPSRLMIGSDWPVCTLSADYARTMGIVFRRIELLPTAEQEAILGENCVRVYRLAT